VCSTFVSKQACIQQEAVVLHTLDAAHNPSWLNRSNGDLDFDTSGMSNAVIASTGEQIGLVSVTDPRWTTGEITHHLKGRSQTPEANKKRSIAQRGKPKPHTPEHGRAISAAKKGCVAPNKGVAHSEATKEKIRQKAIGRKSSLKGIPKSEEQKRKQSEAMKKRHQEKLKSLMP